jgi:elongation factor G
VKVYETSDIRNVALAGHGHCGKTSLAAALLYTTGATNRLTRVDEGNTITDYDEEEIARKLTISTKVAAAEWNRRKINLLDTPGFNMFMADTKSALIAVESMLLVVDAVAGVEVQTERVWEFADEYQLPRAIIVDKLDRERASFERTLAEVQESFGRTLVPTQLPIGAERDFTGIVDVVAMKAYCYSADGNGIGKECDIPSNLVEEAEKAHEALVELIAEGDDDLMEVFFATGTLPEDALRRGLREGIRERRIVPVMCASGLHNVGSDRILDFVVEHFPNPAEHAAWHGTLDGKEADRPVSDQNPVSLYVFKTSADPFAGRVTYFKVISGVVRNDANLLNVRSAAVERLSHIGAPEGKSSEPVPDLHAGDIGSVAKLKDTLTGDTLDDKSSPIAFPPIKTAEPSIAYAISAKTRNDEDRLSNAIHKILEEDPSLRFYRDPQTHEFLVAGSGQQHVEVVVSRLKRRYHVDVELKAPKIPYRETIRGKADVQGRHKKQTGGHGQFGDCWIRMEPMPRGEGFAFANEVFGGAIPRNFIPAIEKGIQETAVRGHLAGYPLVDFKVTVYDGSYHDVDSSEMAFKLAARKAFKAAMEHAKPALLEPIMNVEVHAPVEFAGDLMGDMNGRRGRIAGLDTKGPTQIIKAQVPMSEMLSYGNDLTSMTQGRANFHMEFSHYDFVPGPEMEKIVTAARAAGHGAGEDEE